MEFPELDTGGDVPARPPPPQLLPSDTDELEAARGCRFSTHPSCTTSAIAPITSSSPPRPKTAKSPHKKNELQIKSPTAISPQNRSNETPPYESSGSQIEQPGYRIGAPGGESIGGGGGGTAGDGAKRGRLLPKP